MDGLRTAAWFSAVVLCMVLAYYNVGWALQDWITTTFCLWVAFEFWVSRVRIGGRLPMMVMLCFVLAFHAQNFIYGTYSLILSWHGRGPDFAVWSSYVTIIFVMIGAVCIYLYFDRLRRLNK